MNLDEWVGLRQLSSPDIKQQQTTISNFERLDSTYKND